MPANIRKLIVQVDEVRKEMGQTIEPPTRRAVAIAVIDNPYAGRYSENLDELIAIGEELGALLGQKAVAALGIAPADAQSYGKAAIVGENGELEHAAAILHPKLGAPLRAAVEKGAALVPSAKKRGTLGTAIDVPLGHKDAAFVRSHFDAIEARVNLLVHGDMSSCCDSCRYIVAVHEVVRVKRASDGSRSRVASAANQAHHRVLHARSSALPCSSSQGSEVRWGVYPFGVSAEPQSRCLAEVSNSG